MGPLFLVKGSSSFHFWVLPGIVPKALNHAQEIKVPMSLAFLVQGRWEGSNRDKEDILSYTESQGCRFASKTRNETRLTS
jgi:hypothetical protein